MYSNELHRDTTYRLQDEKILQLLNRLHQAAKGDLPKVAKALLYGIFSKIKPEHAKTAYLPVSKAQGDYLYQNIIEHQCKNIVEFGTSFGISTIYLAAAAKETGGKVITTEVLAEKCRQAALHFEEAGLSDYIELRQGDAMETLKNLQAPIDYLLLDGWKDLYDPLFRMLEPHFHAQTQVFVDNTNFKDVRKFLQRLAKDERYVIQPLQLDKGGSALVTLAK